jgi:hypothetical protein
MTSASFGHVARRAPALIKVQGPVAGKAAQFAGLPNVMVAAISVI